MTVEELDQIRQVVKEEIRIGVSTALRPVNKKLKKIDHTIELVVKYHDEMYIDNVNE